MEYKGREMTDQRERFEAWEKDKIPEWLPANGHTRIFARHAWQAATSAVEQDKWAAVRACVDHINGHSIIGDRSAEMIAGIKAEFPEAWE